MSDLRSRLDLLSLSLAVLLAGAVTLDVVPPLLGWAMGLAALWLGVRGLVAPSRRAERSDDSVVARGVVTAMVVAVAVASLWFRSAHRLHLQQTSALFVGVPAILAVVVVQLARPRSAEGVALKTVSVGLLVSLMLLGEGVLCIVMSAPLFFFIAYLCATAFGDYSSPRGSGRRVVQGLIGVSLLPMSLEGVTTSTTIDRDEVVTVTAVVAAPADAVARALLAPPRFERPRPSPLRLGFPWPEAVRIEQTATGPVWAVSMRGGETRLDGMEPKTGVLRLALADAGPGYVRWQAVSDDSHMRHFLTWTGSEARYVAVDAHRTSVTWSVHYRRDLDPAWYFGPMERLAVRLATRYLIDAVATP